MNKSLLKHSMELLESLSVAVDNASQGETLEQKRFAAMQGVALCQALCANMEVQSAKMNYLAKELWANIDANNAVNEKVSEMAEAEM